MRPAEAARVEGTPRRGRARTQRRTAALVRLIVLHVKALSAEQLWKQEAVRSEARYETRGGQVRNTRHEP